MRRSPFSGAPASRARGRTVGALASGALALALLAGCAEETVEIPPETWEVRGVFEGTEANGEVATITHEDIPGLMDAMQMGFLLTRPDEVAALAPGTKVAFRLDLVEGRIQASGFETLPDTTTLDLEPHSMAPSRADLARPDSASGDTLAAPAPDA